MKKTGIFKINKTSIVWYIIVCIISTAAMVLFFVLSQYYPESMLITLSRDIAVIVTTTFAVSLFIGLIIEKDSKEDIYIEILQHTLQSDSFEKRLSDEEKKNLCAVMNKQFRCANNDGLYDIYSDFEKRFVEENFLKKNYYMEECRYDITCTVNSKESYIEKACKKTMHFKSYAPLYTTPGLDLGTYSSKKVAEKECFELQSLTINGRILSKEELQQDVTMEAPETRDNGEQALLQRNGYNSKIRCRYTKDIPFNSTKSVRVSYKYITRTELSDNALTVRCNQPCKKFSVHFHVTDRKYAVHAMAFGFIDSAKSSPSITDKHTISVDFNNWILPEDGVVILINKESG